MGSWCIALLAGAAMGVLSGFGIGGGTLLLLYMTAFAGLDQSTAQGINLIYFLPTAATALPAHIKNGYLRREAVLPAVLTGLLGTAAGALAATALETSLLRRFFGAYLLYIGIRQLHPKAKSGGA